MSDEILVVEDDDNIRQLLRISLRTEGYRVSEASSGAVALSLFEANAPALVLLDLGLPDRDGMEVLARIRAAGPTPVIVVTARNQDEQKVRALDAGADDYVVKPFSMAELFARIRVALRHRARENDAPAADTARVHVVGGLVIDGETRTVTLDGAPIHLTPYEYSLLLVMVENPGKALTHRFIQKAVWGYPAADEYKTLRVIMASLRRKLGDKPAAPRFIATEVGVGYRFIGE
ncbi:MAG TPA: response regulator transcription factor [Candidatus Aphodovivens avistercoris]|nr:response regulator transcription factor [Candidatus Aphodovivens avistercoris]